MAKGLPADQAVKLLLDAFALVTDAETLSWLAEVIGEVAKSLALTPKTHLLNQAARILLDALIKEKHNYASWQRSVPARYRPVVMKKASVRWLLTAALGEIAKGLPADEAASILSDTLGKERLDQSAELLIDAIAEVDDPYICSRLTVMLREVAKGLPADQTARILRDSLDKQENVRRRLRVAAALGEMIKDLPPARDLLDRAIKHLLDALAKANDTRIDPWLAVESAAVMRKLVEGLPPDQKIHPLNQTAKLLIVALGKTTEGYARSHLAKELAKTSAQASVPKVALLLFRALAEHPDFEDGFLAALGQMATQMELPVAVELLKQPLCYGKARRLFLSRVEQLTARTFSSHWDMVRWLQQHHPEIDLVTPPASSD